jgi:hypothetical protein
MPQIFHPSMNTVARVSIFGAVFIVTALIGLMLAIVRTPYVTGVGVVREQPVQFSHQHHVGDAGLDCRYCHTSVENSSFAGVPATKICMNCHSHLFADSEMLRPVRESFQTGRPLRWTRVHDVPDFVYFDHSIHVQKGVACVTCHGQVNEMPLMWREHTLHMQWCLECHRHPEDYVGERADVFKMVKAPADEAAARTGRELVEAYNIQSKTSCYICHR